MSVMNVVSLIGGLGLFLFGIKGMGEGLEKAAGHKMRKLLEVLTRNKFMAVLMGALVTAVMQSSSATTVMVVGFVNAGLLSLGKAIGVIMGANIGTTVTSLMLSFQVDFGMIFAAIGAICMLLGNRPRLKLVGQIMMGLGVLFTGMRLMTEAMVPLRDWEGFRTMMTGVSNPIVGVLVGTLVTALLQSSAASIGILQALASSGLIGLQGCLFVLFGQNIGTCVTAMLAAVGANKTAKRAAVVHLLFNVIGTVLFVVLAMILPLDVWIQALVGDNIKLQIALAHIVFNLVTTFLLLPLSGVLEKAACVIVRGQDAQQEPMRLMYFDDRLFSTPPIAAQQLFKEVCRMCDLARANLTLAMKYYLTPKDTSVDEFENREQVIDYLNAEITQRLIELQAGSLGGRDVHMVGSLFHVVNDLERIGDHSENLKEIADSLRRDKGKFSGKAEHEIELLYQKVESMVDNAIDIVKRQIIDPEIVGKVESTEAEVDQLCEDYANHHVERIKNKKCTPKNGMLYMDTLNNLERIADHANNLATSVDDASEDAKRMLW